MAKARSGGRRARRTGAPTPAWARDDGTTTDELDGEAVEVRRIQPYQATKAYTCPGCHSPLAARTGHLVVVPVDHPDDRRHWHSSCWTRRSQRRPR